VKILFHYRTRSKDGQTVHIEGLTDALRRAGHEVAILGPAAMERERFGAEAGAVDVMKRQMPRALYEPLELIYNVVAYKRLRAAHLRNRTEALYERYNMGLLAGIWLKRLHRLPMILEVNAPIVEERAAYGGLAFLRIQTAIEGLIWRSADMVFAVSDQMADKIKARGVPAERIVVTPNGVGPEFLERDHEEAGEAVRRRYGLEKRVILGFSGFMREWHGLDDVIEAMAEPSAPRNLHLLVAGDGPARPYLEAQARTLGVADRTTFAGVVPRDDIAAFMSSFDVALQPRVVPYASPLKLFEYMALGRAIIAPNTENIRAVLTNGESGLLIAPGDRKGLLQAVERLAGDPTLRRALGEAARALIVQRGLTWDSNAGRVVAAFNGLMARNSARGRLVDGAAVGL
jgi:glycosyltransferase involved in cell wall biosynthesis